MKLVWILMGMLGTIFFIALLIAYLCYRKAFYVSQRSKQHPVGLPEDEIYGQYRGKIDKWAEKTSKLPCVELETTSLDGLRLRGRYYEFAPGAPIELMFHGYRGTAERDLAGGVQRCFALGRSALIVDQRCSGKSQGHVITFGILEHQDCLQWVDFMVKYFGPDVKIYLCGISMGAATVLKPILLIGVKLCIHTLFWSRSRTGFSNRILGRASLLCRQTELHPANTVRRYGTMKKVLRQLCLH